MNEETELNRLKKAELVDLVISERQRGYEQYDRAEILEKEKEELEEDLEKKIEFEDIGDEARDIISRIKASRWKLDLGVMSEAEEITKLTERLENILA